jgi:peptide/nickel transport system substrate-binding protein
MGGHPAERAVTGSRSRRAVVGRAGARLNRVGAVLPLLLLACAPVGGRRGNTVILASGADLQSPNPLLTVHPLAKQVQRYALLVTLVRYDSTLTPEPYLARSWEWSSDRTALTFRLFPGLRWHDGVPTTARDAAWTLDAARDPVTGYPRRAELADVIGVEDWDDSTLVLRFARPMAAVPDVLTDLALLPAHLLDTVPRSALRRADWNRRPVGNGPFRFVSYQPNRRWVFAANPEFPVELGGPPRLERFVIAVVDEPTTKLAALTAGELDLAGIHPGHAAFVRKDPSLTVLDYPLLFTYALVPNRRRAPFDRLAVRKALSLAVDREAIVNGALFGFGTPASGPLPPPLAPDSLPPAMYAPGRALPLLGGEPVRFELLTVGSGEAALEQMLQAQLAAVGVRAEIRQLELSTYLDRVQGPSRDFDVAVMGVPGDLALGHLLALLDIAGLSWDGDREQLERLFVDSLPVLFLYHARGVQGVNRRVEGIRMDLRGELVTLTRWTVGDDR